jgi:hypothetical protein
MIREIASAFPALGRTEISRTVCELLDWKRPNGGLKNHECRQLLERLCGRGWLVLPPVRLRGPRGPRQVRLTADSDPEPAITSSAAQLEPLRLTVVGAAESRLWAEFLQRYHYLGYRVPVGANLRYWVHAGSGQRLACLLWSSPAWKMAARDRWIGWSAEQRARHLQFVVNNSRFLLLPWVRVPGLASKILAYSARQLPQDWERAYGYRPLLLETLVEAGRFRGTCYRAANWIALGVTAGRGRMDRDHHRPHSPKLVFVYPLEPQVQQRLRQPLTGREGEACNRGNPW